MVLVRNKGWLRALLVVTGLLLPSLPASLAAEAMSAELCAAAVNDVVIDIITYTRWPHPISALQMCIAGQTAYAGSLLGLKHNHEGRVLVTRRIDLAEPAQFDGCDVVYLGKMASAQREVLPDLLNGRGILAIEEDNPGCERGGIFCLRLGEDRVSFSVNLDSLSRSGLKVHPGVLKLGRKGRGAQ